MCLASTIFVSRVRLLYQKLCNGFQIVFLAFERDGLSQTLCTAVAISIHYTRFHINIISIHQRSLEDPKV